MTAASEHLGIMIPFDLINLSRQRVTETLQSRLVLEEMGMHVYMEFYAEDKNEDTDVWEEPKYIYSKTFILRHTITAISKRWDPTNDCWVIKVFSSDGMPYELSIKGEKRCDEVLQQLEGWVTGK